MAISYINTIKVENISKEIMSLANDLETEINNLYRRFSEVPTITKEWVGNQSQIYFRKVGSEKIQYINFVNNIKDISHMLSLNVYEINNCIKKNLDEESKKGS